MLSSVSIIVISCERRKVCEERRLFLWSRDHTYIILSYGDNLIAVLVVTSGEFTPGS